MFQVASQASFEFFFLFMIDFSEIVVCRVDLICIVELELELVADFEWSVDLV